MLFRHLRDDIIEINGEKFDLDIFLEVEPEYSLPEGIVSQTYDGKTHILYTDTGQHQGQSPWKDGDRYLTRNCDLHLLLNMFKEDKRVVEEARVEQPIVTRRNKYPSEKELIVAMWEHFVEGRPAEETINIVQQKRLEVKEKYPK